MSRTVSHDLTRSASAAKLTALHAMQAPARSEPAARTMRDSTSPHASPTGDQHAGLPTRHRAVGTAPLLLVFDAPVALLILPQRLALAARGAQRAPSSTLLPLVPANVRDSTDLTRLLRAKDDMQACRLVTMPQSAGQSLNVLTKP